MNEKIKVLLDIILDAYNHTEHCVKNIYYYSFRIDYNSKSVDAGVDKNMEEYIKANTPQDIYEHYNWHKSSDGARMYISLKEKE